MKKPLPDPVYSLVRWVLLLFIFYALWHSTFTTSHPPQVTTDTAAVTVAAQQPPHVVVDPNMNCDKKRGEFPLSALSFFPSFSTVVRTQEIKVGTGDVAMCGEKVAVDYEWLGQDGKTLGKGKKDIVLGHNDLPHGIELGITGMHQGGERSIMVPHDLITASDLAVLPDSLKKSTVAAKVKLVQVTDNQPASAMKLRAIDDVFGAGTELFCGDEATVMLTFWKTDGSKIYATEKPVKFTLGKAQVPYGIEGAMQGMKQGGSRVVIMPPAYIKSPATDAQQALIPALPENEIIVAEVKLLSPSDTASMQQQPAIATPLPAPSATTPAIVSPSPDAVPDKTPTVKP